jgi:hypothetical protein
MAKEDGGRLRPSLWRRYSPESSWVTKMMGQKITSPGGSPQSSYLLLRDDKISLNRLRVLHRMLAGECGCSNFCAQSRQYEGDRQTAGFLPGYPLLFRSHSVE